VAVHHVWATDCSPSSHLAVAARPGAGAGLASSSCCVYWMEPSLSPIGFSCPSHFFAEHDAPLPLPSPLLQAMSASLDSFEPLAVERHAMGADDVLFDVKFCGVCTSHITLPVAGPEDYLLTSRVTQVRGVFHDRCLRSPGGLFVYSRAASSQPRAPHLHIYVTLALSPCLPPSLAPVPSRLSLALSWVC
jgi:hypothetical protein